MFLVYTTEFHAFLGIQSHTVHQPGLYLVNYLVVQCVSMQEATVSSWAQTRLGQAVLSVN